jgi:hypothetical protein
VRYPQHGRAGAPGSCTSHQNAAVGAIELGFRAADFFTFELTSRRLPTRPHHNDMLASGRFSSLALCQFRTDIAMPTPTIQLNIKNFRAYVPNGAGGGSLTVMTSSNTPTDDSDVTFSVKDGGALLSVVNGNLSISKAARGKNDRVEFTLSGPAGFSYTPQGLVSLPQDGTSKSSSSPFGAFECKGKVLHVYDADVPDTSWEFFVLVQRTREVSVAGNKAYEYSFGLIDPKIQNSKN